MNTGRIESNVVLDDHRPVIEGDLIEALERINSRVDGPQRCKIPDHLLLQSGADDSQIAHPDQVRLRDEGKVLNQTRGDVDLPKTYHDLT